MVQSLETKLHEFAAGLTAEESAQVCGLLAEIDRALPLAMRAKARQFVHALTPEEAAQLALVAQRATGDLVRADAAEVTGYAIAEYEDAYGYKGKIGTGGESRPPASGSTPLGGPLGVWLLGVGTLFGHALTMEYPDPNP
jgi:hypothetical protein